jgi:hypothetical protein
MVIRSTTKIPLSTPSFCQMESRGQQASHESLFHGRGREVEDDAVLLHIGSLSSIPSRGSEVEDSAALLNIGSRSSACCTPAPPTSGIADCHRRGYLCCFRGAAETGLRRLRCGSPPLPSRVVATIPQMLHITSPRGLPRRRVQHRQWPPSSVPASCLSGELPCRKAACARSCRARRESWGVWRAPGSRSESRREAE